MTDALGERIVARAREFRQRCLGEESAESIVRSALSFVIEASGATIAWTVELNGAESREGVVGIAVDAGGEWPVAIQRGARGVLSGPALRAVSEGVSVSVVAARPTSKRSVLVAKACHAWTWIPLIDGDLRTGLVGVGGEGNLALDRVEWHTFFEGLGVWELVRRRETRSRARSARARSRERTAEAIIQGASDGILTFDDDGEILRANAAAAQMFGMSEKRLSRLTLSDLVSDTLSRSVFDAIEGRQDANWVHDAQGYAYRDDASAFDIDMRVSETEDRSRYIALIRDISSRKRVERFQDAFISTVSHELRTPLTSIRAALMMLDRGVLTLQEDRGRKLLAISVRNTERLIDLVNDILDFERIKADGMTLELSRFDVTSLVAAAVDEISGLAARRQIEIETRVATKSVGWGDPSRITQVLVNLLSNAVKFSPPRTRVSVRVEDGTDESLCYSVTDQGSGIPAAEVKRIFEPFLQLADTERREQEGSGLGLAIVSGIIRRHGGELTVDSQVGIGSRFSFVLPVEPTNGAVEGPARGGLPVLHSGAPGERPSEES